MKYRDHKAASDRAYLSEMFARHATVSEVARQSGLSRSHLYRLASRVGFQMPVRQQNKGNEAWQALSG